MLHTVAVVSLAVAVTCALLIAAHVTRHPQHMFIMNLVWPITALYAGPLALWAYLVEGRKSSREAMAGAGHGGHGRERPLWRSVALAASHCGSGCTLGDLVAEWFVVLVPVTLFGSRLFGTWALDYALAFVFGIAFQYFTIAPMRGLSLGAGLGAALKADSLSLTSWQVGMYGWMAIVIFVLFGHELPKTDAVFWFMMQIAMLAGFLTSYPVNWWLVQRGIKERM